jgi:hypothetical protein
MTVHARAKDVDDLASARPPYRNAPEYETGFSVLRKFIGARISVGSRGVAREEIRMPRELPKRTMRIFAVMGDYIVITPFADGHIQQLVRL